MKAEPPTGEQAVTWEELFDCAEPGATAEELGAIERELGIRIPEQLRGLWTSVGAGRFVRRTSMPSEEPVHELLSVRRRPPPEGGTLDRPGYSEAYGQFIPELVNERFFPFVNGPMGDLFCIDRRDGGIVFIALDSDGAAPQRLADSLHEFMSSLT